MARADMDLLGAQWVVQLVKRALSMGSLLGLC